MLIRYLLTNEQYLDNDISQLMHFTPIVLDENIKILFLNKSVTQICVFYWKKNIQILKNNVPLNIQKSMCIFSAWKEDTITVSVMQAERLL